MQGLRIKGHLIDVNIIEELEEYASEFNRARVRDNKLQSCSPFRQESNPSFAVNLETGVWIDSGASDESMRKGNLVSLLAHLRGEDYDDTAEYLIDKYAKMLSDVDGLSLNMNLSVEKESDFNPDETLRQMQNGSHYLFNRGISYNTQNAFGIGTVKNAVVMTWRDKSGDIINFKYRSTTDKRFWYSSGGEQIKHHMYGMDLYHRFSKSDDLWLVESEIDCMYLWDMGFPAVAFGHGSMSEQQKQIIMGCGAKRLIIATDNDTVGHRFAKVLKDEFMGWFTVARIYFPTGVKDVNEMSREQLQIASNNLIIARLFS